MAPMYGRAMFLPPGRITASKFLPVLISHLPEFRIGTARLVVFLQEPTTKVGTMDALPEITCSRSCMFAGCNLGLPSPGDVPTVLPCPGRHAVRPKRRKPLTMALSE